jgi:hypothetical protein
MRLEMNELEVRLQVDRLKAINDALNKENQTQLQLRKDAEARVTELQAKLADVSEHAAYEQRRADGAVAELVEVHAKLAEAERKHLDAWRESQVERESAVRAERALDEALFRQLL